VRPSDAVKRMLFPGGTAAIRFANAPYQDLLLAHVLQIVTSEAGRMFKKAICSLSFVFLASCYHATAPLKVEQRVAQTPQRSQLTVAAQSGTIVGQIVPVDVNIANGTPDPYRVDTTQVFAIAPSGQRIVPVSVEEAIRLSGDEVSLAAQIQGAVLTGLVGAAAGAAGGAGVGTATGDVGGGIAAGGAIGGVGGAAMGAASAQEEQRRVTAEQIKGYALQDRYVKGGYSVSGYVFYPPGTYVAVEALLTGEEGETQTARGSISPPLTPQK